jgi:hypothetical protein
MSLRLIGIVLASVIGFAQAPAPDPAGFWRTIRSALMAPDGDTFFQQIKNGRIPQRFSGAVVSQPSPNKLIVNVDNPVVDAILRSPIAVKRHLAAGAPVQFEGVVRAYSRNPYRLIIEVLPEDTEGLY